MAFAWSLNGRVALVTGAGAGPGRAVAVALGRAGASVMVNDVNPGRAEETAMAVVEAGGSALAWTADVSNKFQVGAMIERLRDEFGGLHIVVNGWAVNKVNPFLTLDEYDWRRVIEVNLTGRFFISQMAARVMVDEGGGIIVHLVTMANGARTHQVPFVVSQAAVKSLADVLATELTPLGVRTLAVPVDEDDQVTAAAVMQALGVSA